MVKKLVIPATLACGLIVTSCAKEKITGCTDVYATNYNSVAETDNGSCQFEGKLVFWYGKSTAEALSKQGSTSLKYYVDGILIGSSAASVYFTGAPACDQSSTVSVKKSLGSVKSKSFPYVIKDQDEDIIWSGNASLDASQSCFLLELAP